MTRREQRATTDATAARTLAPGERRPEKARQLPAGWRPREPVETRIKAMGFDPEKVLALYRRDMEGALRKRWLDQSFLSWCIRVVAAGALPRVDEPKQ